MTNTHSIASEFSPARERTGMIRYVVPEQCMFCGTAGHLALTARTPGGAVVICWHCGHCRRDWPVKHDERLEEQRSGLADRRRTSRADRRQRAKSA